MTVLLTGGAGFIGSNLADHLLNAGQRVITLDSFEGLYDASLKRKNISGQLNHARFTLVEGDIRDSKVLNQIFTEHTIETVIHIAARAGVRPSILEPALYFDVNVNGTISLLEAMRAYGVKNMLFASSSSVYGNNTSVPFKETDNVDNPISPYAASKKACELICHTYCHLFNFNIFCFRFFTVYGPRQRPDMAIHYFTEAIATGKPINLYGDGSTRRDYTYIEDIVDGLAKALDKVKGYEILNLGESQTIALIDLVELIEKELGKKAIINWLPLQAGDVQLTYADINKAKQLIGYKPMHSVEDGIIKYVKYYKAQIGIKA
jgi:UDP-glucuronate 4-epimerase